MRLWFRHAPALDPPRLMRLLQAQPFGVIVGATRRDDIDAADGPHIHVDAYDIATAAQLRALTTYCVQQLGLAFDHSERGTFVVRNV